MKKMRLFSVSVLFLLCVVAVAAENDFTCEDTESTNDYYGKGTATIADGSTTSSFSDTCLSDWLDVPGLGDVFIGQAVAYGVLDESQKTNRNILIESKCTNPVPDDAIEISGSTITVKPSYLQQAYECPNGCSQGVCVEGEQEEASCEEEWSCTSYGSCDGNDVRHRTCTDANNCGTILDRPALTALCDDSCEESWTCEEWGRCIDQVKTRSCTDTSGCKSVEFRPELTMECDADESATSEVFNLLIYETLPSGNAVPADGAKIIVDGVIYHSMSTGRIGFTHDGYRSVDNREGLNLVVGEKHSLVVSKSGFTPYEYIFTLKQGDPLDIKIILGTDQSTSTFPPRCDENWFCVGWSDCEGSQQTRTCVDQHQCGTEESKPSEVRLCNDRSFQDPCKDVEWECTEWSACELSVRDEYRQSRVCVISNADCREAVPSPEKSRECTPEQKTEQEYQQPQRVEPKQLHLSSVKIQTTLPVTEEFAELYVTTSIGKQRIDAQKVKQMQQKYLDDVTSAELVEKSDGRATYVLSGKKKGLLFSIIPVTLKTELSVDAQEGYAFNIKKPWWAFLVNE